MAAKNQTLPKMESFGVRAREPEGTNERTGVTRYRYFCEGCGWSKVIPDNSPFDPTPPIFWSDKKGGCGCTKRRELTDYYDECTYKECKNPIYLTPGAATSRKILGASYEQKKKYCDTCLDGVVHRGDCRNAGCRSIGGSGVVEATLRNKLNYERQNLNFPPRNCEVCRNARKAFEQRREIRPTCEVCKKPFRVTYGRLIMILKNQDQFEIPKECPRCSGLSPEERRAMENEAALDDLRQQRRREMAKILAGDKRALARERTRLTAANQLKKEEFLQMLNQKQRLAPKDVRSALQAAQDTGVLLPILADPRSVGHREVRQSLAQVTGGRANMTDLEFEALPRAFHAILERHPSAMGIFKKAPAHRAPGMSAVNQHYEILAAAALQGKQFPTASGKKLTIRKKDRVDFGMRFPHEHVQPRRYKTIEADILIHRPQGLLPDRVIGVDAKYTKASQYAKKDDLQRQLDGIRNTFRDDHLHEFHFVTNKTFANDFKKAVDKTNILLVRDYVTNHNEHFSSSSGIKELSYLTNEEKQQMPGGPISLADLDNLQAYSDKVRKFAEKYTIEQIEICENVRYPDT